MSEEVTKEELDKVKPEIINEQAVLLLNLSKVMKDIVLYPPTRLGYDYFSCLLDREPAFLHNHLFGNDFMSLLNLKPYQLAIFTPKLKFYKKMITSEEYIEMVFDDHLNKDSHLSRYSPGEILSGNASDGSGVGILGFEWKLNGDITDTPEKRLQTYTADLRLRIEKITDLHAPRTDFKGRTYQLSDLFSPERGSGRAPDEVDENAYELLVDVGWNVLSGEAKDNEIYKSIPEETIEAIRKTTMLLKLGLHDHNLEFNQDGSLGLTLNYIASLSSRTGNPLASNLIKGKYRSQIEGKVVSNALAEASNIDEDEKDTNKRAQLDAAKEYYNILNKLKEDYDGIKYHAINREKVGEAGIARAIEGWARWENKTGIASDLARIREIYANFAEEHQSEIDQRIAEFQDYKSARFVLDYLLDSNRIKVFQVKKENVLLTDKMITTKKYSMKRRTKAERGSGSLRDGEVYKVEETTERVESASGLDTISEKYEAAGLYPTSDTGTGRLKEVLLFHKVVRVYDERGKGVKVNANVDTSTEDGYPVSESLLVVRKIYPQGKKAAHYHVSFKDADFKEDTFIIPVDSDNADARVSNFIAKYTNGTGQSMESTIDPSQGAVDIALANSDTVYRAGLDVAERMQELRDIDEGATDGSESVAGIRATSEPWQKDDEYETMDQFAKNMADRIIQGREVKEGDTNFLNIKYVTVGDIFDAILHRAYVQDENFKDKFLLGPIVINEAEALIGGAGDIAITYPEADTKSIEVVVSGTKEKQRTIKEEIFKDRVDRVYSLADLPISLDSLLLWMQKNISENRAKVMTFDKFLTGLLKTLLNDAYSIKSEARHLLPKANFNFQLDSFPLLQPKSSTSSRSGTSSSDVFGMSANAPYVRKIFDRKFLNTRLVANQELTESIKKSTSRNVAEDTAEGKARIVDYHIITSKCKLPDKRLYNYLEDMKVGIPHFFIGQDSGIVKSIEFSQADIPGLLEKNVLNAQNAIREGTSPAGVYLKKPYNATVNLVGNPFFSRGQMVFINPSLAGAGSLKDRASEAFRLGLGGYYRITEISNRIDASGKYETQLECVWQSYGTGRRSEADKQTEPKSQEFDKNMTISEPDAPLEMLGDHLQYAATGKHAVADRSSHIGEKAEGKK